MNNTPANEFVRVYADFTLFVRLSEDTNFSTFCLHHYLKMQSKRKSTEK